VKPITGTVNEKTLADPYSKFITINGIDVHYKEQGSGEKTYILLHGFGASLFSWREVMPELAKNGRVIAFDRPAFGLTSRQLTWQGESPYGPEAQVYLTIDLMDALGVEKAYLVGHSAGGVIALDTALQFPNRVNGLVLVDAAVFAGGGAPNWALPLLNTPQANHLGPLLARQLQTNGDVFLRSAWHDPSKITLEIYDGYHKPLEADNWDIALWNLTKSTKNLGLDKKLADITVPTLVIAGDDDQIVPTNDSRKIAANIPNSTLSIIKDAGHLPHEEQPADFMKAIISFTK
jgi:pimeloyl-ACP methyl ester carboxylesterase